MITKAQHLAIAARVFYLHLETWHVEELRALQQAIDADLERRRQSTGEDHQAP